MSLCIFRAVSGGGFRPHKGYVERKNVEAVYQKLLKTGAVKTQKKLFFG